MSRIISFVCLKGGVGKTTIATNIAAYLAANRRETLLVELDYPSVSRYVFSEEELSIKMRRTLYDILRSRLIGTPVDVGGAAIRCERWEDYLHVIVGGEGLERFEKDASRTPNWVRFLDETLDYVRRLYKFVILDCPPRFGVLTMMAIYASNYYVIPTVPDHLNLRRAKDTLQTIESFAESVMAPAGKSVKCLGVILNRRRRVAHHTEMVKKAWELLGENIFRNILGDSIAYAVSLKEHTPIYRLRRSYRDAVEQFDALYNEFMNRIAAMEKLGAPGGT